MTIKAEDEIQISFEDGKAIVYSFKKPSEADVESLGVPHMDMVPEYVIPLESVADVWPRMTIADKIALIHISVKMIDHNRAERASEERTAYD